MILYLLKTAAKTDAIIIPAKFAAEFGAVEKSPE